MCSYGKALVVDMMDVDFWHALGPVFDTVRPKLLTDIVSKAILKPEWLQPD